MKYTLEDIKLLSKEGMSYRQIAKKFQVHPSTISYRMRKDGICIYDSEDFVKEGEECKCKNCGRVYIKERKKGHKGILCNSCSSRKKEEVYKSKIKEIIGSICCRCGYNKCKVDYHHVISENKSFEFGNSFTQKSLPDLIKEAHKCIPLCSNCHREYHFNLFKYEELNPFLLKEYQKELILTGGGTGRHNTT